MKSERALQTEIRLGCGQLPNARLWRNQVGVAKHEGRVVRYGLAVGSSDLIGIRAVTITPAHVGRVLGQFAAVEIKTDSGRLSTEQILWAECVSRWGGLAVTVRSLDEALAALRGDL